MHPRSPNPGEAPSAYEKLPHKYILDAIHHADLVAGQRTGEISASPVDSHTNEPKSPVRPQTKKAVDPLKLALEPNKKYFRIGEAADCIEVEPYVLRYWENEFPAVRPMKSRSGHRVYSKKDLMVFEQVRNLLYVEKFSIKGAKAQLAARKKQVQQEAQRLPTVDEQERRDRLKRLLGEIKALIHVAKSTPWSV